MANEAKLRVRIENPLPFTIADTAFEKGALMTLTDPRTCVANVSGAVVAGILAREKVVGDGRTEVACFRRGWFDMVCSGAVLIGEAVMAADDGNNGIMAADVFASGAQIIGHALEAGADGEQILVDVNIGAGGSQIS